MIQGRRLAHQFHEGLKQYFPSAFSASMLINTASVIGTREGRRIVGEYRMTIDDYLSKRTFEDEICRNSYYIDVHLTREELEKATRKGIDRETINPSLSAGGVPWHPLSQPVAQGPYQCSRRGPRNLL